MNVREFRIGNYIVDYETEPNQIHWQIEQIRPSSLQSKNLGASFRNNSCWTLDPEPIELTEEWFVNFGLVCDKDKGVTFLYSYSFYIVYEAEDDYCVYEYVNDNFITSVKYVHQLQNLYFSLTGEELILNNPL